MESKQVAFQARSKNHGRIHKTEFFSAFERMQVSNSRLTYLAPTVVRKYLIPIAVVTNFPEAATRFQVYKSSKKYDSLLLLVAANWAINVAYR